jgi:hypothetical protein
VCKFDQEEASEISRNILAKKVSAQLIATVRQTMTRQGLVLDRPFRILFAGESSAKTIIVERLERHLLCRSLVDRPLVLFAGDRHVSMLSQSLRLGPCISEVELIDSSGLEIIVDHCTSAQSTKTMAITTSSRLLSTTTTNVDPRRMILEIS